MWVSSVRLDDEETSLQRLASSVHQAAGGSGACLVVGLGGSCLAVGSAGYLVVGFGGYSVAYSVRLASDSLPRFEGWGLIITVGDYCSI